MVWYIYELGPIDFAWQHLKTVDETARELGAISASAEAAGFADQNEIDVPVAEFLAGWKDAIGSTCGGEKLRREPVVFWVPNSDQYRFDFGFVIKADNNGTTYVVSPVELPHLGTPSPS